MGRVYLKLLSAVALLLLLGLGGFNYIVDPYGIYMPDRTFSFNRNKTEFFMKEPMIKPYRVSDVHPSNIILGVSNAGLGYDEDHACFSDEVVYNFSMAGASMYMLYRAFQHAHAQAEAPLERVVLDLNLISFNEYHSAVVSPQAGGEAGNNVFEELIAVKQDGSRNWFALFRQISQVPRFLLSLSATLDSLNTLRNQGPYDGWSLNKSGGWRGGTLRPEQSQARRFMTVERYLFGSFFNEMSSTGKFSIYREDGALSRAFGYYERLLHDAYTHDIDLMLVLSPSHAYFYEAIQYQGFESMFTDWKRQVVRINERVARAHDRTPFAVWDFANYSTLTTEPLPANQPPTARMAWYFDPIHFQRALGDIVLDQVCLDRDGVGAALTVENLDDKLQIQARDKQQFQRENKTAVDRLKALFMQVSGKQPH